MRVAITGTTGGLGSALVKVFESEGYRVFHLNRPEFDLGSINMDEIPNADIYINNAYSYEHGFGQTDFLYKWFQRFKDTNKHLVNIGSVSSDGDRAMFQPYAVHKTALEKANTQLQLVNSRCKLTLVKPGRIDTKMVSHIDSKKMKPDDVARQIFEVTQVAGSMYIKSITLDIKQ